MMAISAPERAKEVFLSEFDAAWTYNTYWQATWHCFLSGRIPRLHAIASMIEYMLDKGGVWFATLEEIAMHVRKLVDEGSYEPRVHTLPIKDGRIADIPDPIAGR
jgi:hypothetical protein